MTKLNGKIALITGGTSGMGAATAKLFQQEGAKVIVTGGSSAGIDAARKAMPDVEARVRPLEDMEESVFDDLFNTNIRGPYFLLKYASPVLSEGASVILTSSTASVQGMPGVSAYGASKAALRSLGLNLAVELAPRKIRVNTITPGPINTPIGSKMGLTAEQMAGFGQMIAKLPLGRPGEPDEIAAAALYFASDDSKFTTGSELRLDGGLTLV